MNPELANTCWLKVLAARSYNARSQKIDKLN